ncbi:hypothetical protein ACFQL7_11610 [Halocatena marina]|uniref:Uncharacterized protein n=1 Tax=Halocatena marina TaxID=2934937 RepID=A0ABD5YSF3_9EURY
MRARHVAVVALLIGLVVLALPVETGLFTVADDHATSVDSIETSGSLESNAMQSAPPDPNTDTLGWESGYWYNESITVDQSDGLSESELDAFLARSMARVEHIRRLEFTEQVEIEFVRPENLDPPETTRSDLRRTSSSGKRCFSTVSLRTPHALFSVPNRGCSRIRCRGRQ